MLYLAIAGEGVVATLKESGLAGISFVLLCEDHPDAWETADRVAREFHVQIFDTLSTEVLWVSPRAEEKFLEKRQRLLALLDRCNPEKKPVVFVTNVCWGLLCGPQGQ
jgi:hypothetical protein